MLRRQQGLNRKRGISNSSIRGGGFRSYRIRSQRLYERYPFYQDPYVSQASPAVRRRLIRRFYLAWQRWALAERRLVQQKKLWDEARKQSRGEGLGKVWADESRREGPYKKALRERRLARAAVRRVQKQLQRRGMYATAATYQTMGFAVKQRGPGASTRGAVGVTAVSERRYRYV